MQEKSETKKKKSKKWLKIVLSTLFLLAAAGSLWIYKSDQDAQVRREVFQQQQEKMVDFWQEQGLSEEEIQDKLAENRIENQDFQPTILQSLLRTFRHTTGTGPGGGERGTLPPSEGGMGDGSGRGRALESK
jgi:hypothetical protein